MAGITAGSTVINSGLISTGSSARTLQFAMIVCLLSQHAASGKTTNAIDNIAKGRKVANDPQSRE